MNSIVPLFALLAARQANDSSSDTGRIALMSMAVKPPMLGLLLAVVMAKQASRPVPTSEQKAGAGNESAPAEQQQQQQQSRSEP